MAPLATGANAPLDKMRGVGLKGPHLIHTGIKKRIFIVAATSIMKGYHLNEIRQGYTELKPLTNFGQMRIKRRAATIKIYSGWRYFMKKLQKLLNIYLNLVEAEKELKELPEMKKENAFYGFKGHAIENLQWAIYWIEDAIKGIRREEEEGE